MPKLHIASSMVSTSGQSAFLDIMWLEMNRLTKHISDIKIASPSIVQYMLYYSRDRQNGVQKTRHDSASDSAQEQGISVLLFHHSTPVIKRYMNHAQLTTTPAKAIHNNMDRTFSAICCIRFSSRIWG
jgi:hypothetical protein